MAFARLLNVKPWRYPAMWAIGIAVALSGVGCSSGVGSQECLSCQIAPRPAIEFFVPQVQELYPVPGASLVPEDARFVVYASTQSVPISLARVSEKTGCAPQAIPTNLPIATFTTR